MITCFSIKGQGSRYMESHLSSNDYYEEGGKVSGEWFGSAVEKLGLTPGSEVSKEAFAALGGNRHPVTGEQLTARNSDRRKSWTDVQFSAPKSVSILAVVGGDERVKLAFDESVKVALREMETFAGTRERRGAMHAEDRTRSTANLAAALYRHDASRSLDPQLHTHAVIPNCTWDAETSSWRALQAREMMKASAYARRVMYADLAARLEKLGYQVVNRSEDGFQVKGVEGLEERYSGRTEEIDKLAAAFEAEKGRAPTNRERAVLVRESRSDKLQEISTPEVRKSQIAKLTPDERKELDRLTVEAARESQADAKGKTKPTHSPAPLSGAALDEYLDVGLDHVTEHASVGNDWEALAVALDHAAQAGVQLDAAALRARFDERADVVKREGWLFTTTEVLEREREAVRLALAGRGSEESSLANVEALEKQQLTAERPLLPEQLAAARTLAASRDRTTILIGDAGTGKTSTLSALRAASGAEWMALGPTTGAVDELRKSGFEKAATMQSYLDHPEKWAALSGGVVLLDEAGAVGSKDLHAIQQAAKANQFRLVLVGDVKQHASVTEGDALRAVLDESVRKAPKGEAHALTVARLTTVLRQRVDVDKKIAETLGKGDFADGLDQQEKAGHIHEQDNEKKLFAEAAAYAVQRRRELAHPAKGSGQRPGVLVIVTPRWSDAEKLAVEMRPLMRADGQLVGEDRRVSVVEPVALTASQKRLAASYTAEKSVLTFTRKDEELGTRAGENWLVTGIDKDGVFARRFDSTAAPRRIAWADLGRNTQVGRVREIELAAGDDILLRAEARNGKKKIAPNGSVRTIERIAEDGKIHLRGGGVLPADFRHFSYGYGKTSHKAQGSSEAEAMVVMGQSASEGASRRQWYVSSTRHQLVARYFVSSLDAVRKALGRSDDRQLAGEMVVGRKRAERSQATGAGKPAAAVSAAVSPAPAPAKKAAPVVVATPVPSPAKPEASREADASIIKRTVRIARGFFAGGPMADVPPSGTAAHKPKTESQMQEPEKKKPTTAFRASAPVPAPVPAVTPTPAATSPAPLVQPGDEKPVFRTAAAASSAPAMKGHEMKTAAEFTADKAIREGQPITYSEILDMKWNDYPSYTPKQNEYALRYLRVELWEAKLEQNKQLDRLGIRSPELQADTDANEAKAQAQIAEDRDWLKKQAGWPDDNDDKDFRPSEELKMSRVPDTKLLLVPDPVAAEAQAKDAKRMADYLSDPDEEGQSQSEEQGPTIH